MKLTGRTIKITAVILVASILLSATATAASFEDFGDAQGHWAEDYLRRAVREGLLTGTTPTTLEPGVPANLPQALTILCRLLEPETAAETPEIAGHWYTEYVERALSLDIDIDLDRLSHGQFTRAEAFCLLAQAFRLTSADPDLSVLSGFTDTDLMTYDQRAAAAALVSGGYVNGSGTRLMPTKTVTRAELLTMFLRIAEQTYTGRKSPQALSGGAVFTDTGNLSGRKYTSPVWIAAGVRTVDLSGLHAGTVVVMAEDADIILDGSTNIFRLVLAGGKSQDVTFDTGRIGTLVISPGAPNTVRVGAGVDNVEITADGKNVYITDDLGRVFISGSGNTVNVSAAVNLLESGVGSSGNTINTSANVRELNIDGEANRVSLGAKAVEARLGGSGCTLTGFGSAKRLHLTSHRSTSSLRSDEKIEEYPGGLGELELEVTAPGYVEIGSAIDASVTVKNPEDVDVTLTWRVGDEEIKTEKLTATPAGVSSEAAVDVPLVNGMYSNAYISVTAESGGETVGAFCVTALDGLDRVMEGARLTVRNNGSTRGGNVKVIADIASPLKATAVLDWYECGELTRSEIVEVAPESSSISYDYAPTSVGNDGLCAVRAVLSFTGGGKTSSVYGERTVEAGVTAAQALAAVTSDYAGDYTLEWALNNDYSENVKTVWVNAMGYSSDTQYLIWVNRTYQRVNIFIGSQGNWKLDRVFLCGTGKRGSSTPVGEYTVWAFQEGWHHSTYWCEPVVRFYTGSGYAFHSRLWKPGHETLQDDRIGFPISAGCVRMYDEDVQWMYDNIPMNTKVVVH